MRYAPFTPGAIQLGRNFEAMPSEDAFVVWPEEESPSFLLGA